MILAVSDAVARVAETVTWVTVPKPTFDLVGVVLGSFGLAGLCAAVATVLGVLLGLTRIVQGRHSSAYPAVQALDLADTNRA